MFFLIILCHFICLPVYNVGALNKLFGAFFPFLQYLFIFCIKLNKNKSNIWTLGKQEAIQYKTIYSRCM